MKEFPINISLLKNLDILDQIVLQEKEAFDFGFYWESIDQLWDQIESEVQEIKEAYAEGNSSHLQEEIGDLIQAALGLCVFCGFHPQETLEVSLEKFDRRFKRLKTFAYQEGHTTLKGQPLNILLQYWHRAKKFQNEE